MSKKTSDTKAAKPKKDAPGPLSSEEAEAVQGGAIEPVPNITSTDQLRKANLSFHNYEPPLATKTRT